MSEIKIEDFRADNVFRDDKGQVWMTMSQVREACAQAWDAGFDAAEEDWSHHDEAGWGNEECLDKTHNPYRDLAMFERDLETTHAEAAEAALERVKALLVRAGTYGSDDFWAFKRDMVKAALAPVTEEGDEE